ncbi:isoprenylcysteine carboxylmethyltransferase family protein [Candidatus Igneacidithiobacillus taiwanensis]|uniref:methyltransferase family protein n=1 Tax=Candidatus Igneacidithiobacillus taiwanensis TaxID=1945924 RepID=UPI0028A05580|nr:isoprenylcysteine carboxylmethyltransferase family protein [Candidatus Igneacidithiobacillus taiwanensis]MCE5360562.1 isoprenylcysteine carboxylmethyltransferase family protein [Acidithiobacillus sp.]
MNYAPLITASTIMMLTEGWIAWRFKSVDPNAIRSRARMDRYGFLLVGLSVDLAIFLGKLLSATIASRITPDMPWTTLGVGLLVLGYVIRFWAITTAGKAFSFDLRVEENQKLVDDGPYRYVRHPSYTGSLVAFLGIGFLSESLFASVILMMTLFFFYRVRIKREESILTANLSGYSEYCKRTRYRLIPGIL